MLKWFLVRHGEDDFELGNDSIGRSQMVNTASFLKNHGRRFGFDFRTTLIHTSPSDRTVSSADILSKQLSIAPAVQESWLTEEEAEHSQEKLIQLTDGWGQYIPEGSIIIVTHYPNIVSIVNSFGSSWGVTRNFSTDNGSIHFVDREAHSLLEIYS